MKQKILTKIPNLYRELIYQNEREEGLEIYKTNNVKYVTIEIDDYRAHFSGIVLDPSDNRYYYTQGYVFGFEGRYLSIDTKCSCSSYYLCRHAFAILYFLIYKEVQRRNAVYSADSSVNYELLYQMQANKERLEHLYQRDNQLENLQLLEDGPLYLSLDITKNKDAIRFKFGSDKLFVIKDIIAFVKAVNGNDIYINNGREYHLSNEAFQDEQSKSLLLLMNKLVNRSGDATKKNEYDLVTHLQLIYQYASNALEQLGINITENECIHLTIDDLDNACYRIMFSDKQVKLYTLNFQPSAFITKTKKDAYQLTYLPEHIASFVYDVVDNIAMPKETQQQDIQRMIDYCQGYVDFDNYDSQVSFNNHIIKIYIDINDQDELVHISCKYETDNGLVDKAFNIAGDGKITKIFEFINHYALSYDQDNAEFYIDHKKKKGLEFLQKGLEPLKKYAEVYASQSVVNLSKARSFKKMQTGVRFNNGLLQVDLSLEGVKPQEWADIIHQYKRKKKFFKLKDGTLLDLTDNNSLEDIVRLMDQLNVDESSIDDNGTFNAKSYRLLGLEDDLKDAQFLDVRKDESVEKALDTYIEYNPKNYKVPKKFDQIFRDYQKEGYKWLTYMLNSGFNPILADDMGLGKTLQVLALLESIKDNGNNIIVCPATLVYNWKEEIEKFNVDIDAICVVGTRSQREEIYAQQHQLYITSYDYIRKDVDLIENKEFNLAILDEAQYIKNATTKNADSVKKINAKHRLALTGTPIENSLAELWSIFDFLMPGYLYSYKYFRKTYEKPIVYYQDDEMSERLKRLVAPFILRRVKQEVLLELPEKMEIVEYVSFNEEEDKIYNAELKSTALQIQGLDFSKQTERVKVLAMLLKLRQICCDLRLVYENVNHESSKVESAFDIIQNVKQQGNKVLLFSSFTSMLELLENKSRQLGIKYHKLTGSDSKEKRKKTIEEFQNDDSTLFLISLKAGGTGLNLTAANTVIHFDPWWNQSATNQASDRAYRIGQEKDVTVYKLVMKDSIEEKIIKLQEKKQNLADEFVQSNSGGLSQLSKDELLDLFD